MSNKVIYWIVGITLAVTAIYFFAPPVVDFSGRGSRFNQWVHRNDSLKGVEGAPAEYPANSDHKSPPKTPVPRK